MRLIQREHVVLKGTVNYLGQTWKSEMPADSETPGTLGLLQTYIVKDSWPNVTQRYPKMDLYEKVCVVLAVLLRYVE
jgi:hypothetical protein